jgi:hypothetical protein
VSCDQIGVQLIDLFLYLSNVRDQWSLAWKLHRPAVSGGGGGFLAKDHHACVSARVVLSAHKYSFLGTFTGARNETFVIFIGDNFGS